MFQAGEARNTQDRGQSGGGFDLRQGFRREGLLSICNITFHYYSVIKKIFRLLAEFQIPIPSRFLNDNQNESLLPVGSIEARIEGPGETSRQHIAAI